MTILSGLVLAILVGTLLQGGSGLIPGNKVIAPKDDIFYVHVDRAETLDVLINDEGVDASMPIKMMSLPECGRVEVLSGTLFYLPKKECLGTYTLTYCVEWSSLCPTATVTIKVHDTGDDEGDNPVASLALDPTYSVDPDKAAIVTEAAPDENFADIEPTLTAAVLPVEEAEEVQGPILREFRDPYLQAISGIVAWQPDGIALPDTPSALLFGEAPPPLDPEASRVFLWEPLVEGFGGVVTPEPEAEASPTKVDLDAS